VDFRATASVGLRTRLLPSDYLLGPIRPKDIAYNLDFMAEAAAAANTAPMTHATAALQRLRRFTPEKKLRGSISPPVLDCYRSGVISGIICRPFLR
jgi:hypothetical protein